MAADALGTPAPAATPTVGVVSDEDHRLAMAGMVAPQTSTLAVRTGVMWGPGTTALVTGTSATGTMTYAIAAHHAVTTRGTADGVYLGPTLDAATTVPTTAAPGSNSRIDIIWSKQNDTSSTVSADTGSTAPLYGVANGTAAVSPVAPAIPVGAIELARATVAVGATSTNGAGVTITNTAVQTVARGAPVPCRSQAERDALTTFPNLTVSRLDLGTLEVYSGGTWKTVAFNFSPIQGTLYRFNNQTIGSDLTTPAVIVLNAARAGYSGLLVDGNTGIVTVGTGGEFIVSAAVAIAEVGASRVFASIYVNAVERIRGLDFINRGATSGDVVGSVVSGLLTLNANDQITLRALHTGASATVTPGEAITYMQLRKIA